MAEVVRKGKRFNIQDNFEEIYLQVKELGRYIPKANPKIFQEPWFIKAVKDKTLTFWKKDCFFWSSHGFEKNDLHNIILLIGYSFHGADFKGATVKDTKNIMLRFIDQRYFRIKGATARKFQLGEVVRDNHELADEDQLEKDYNPEEDLQANENTPCQNENDESPSEPLELEESFLISSVNNLRRDNAYIESKTETIKRDPKKYESELCLYATYKVIPMDVRKAAQVKCKQFGIDFIGWAKKRILDGANPAEFDLYQRGYKWSKRH